MQWFKRIINDQILITNVICGSSKYILALKSANESIFISLFQMDYFDLMKNLKYVETNNNASEGLLYFVTLLHCTIHEWKEIHMDSSEISLSIQLTFHDWNNEWSNPLEDHEYHIA